MYLNFELVKELEHKKKEDVRTHSFKYKEEALAINSEVLSAFNES
jgi:hypothetical protein